MNGLTTYILKTESNEYYCGVTNNLERRLKEHQLEKYPHWFNSINRKKFKLVVIFKGDCEKIIKKAGVKSIAIIFKHIKKVVRP